MQLELLNLELQLIEPWIAGGKLVTTVTSIDKDIQAAVLQIGGAHMVLPVWSGKGAQYVPGHHAGSGTLSFVVPGVPETVGAYEIWPGGMRALLPVRVTGGVSVTVDDFGLTSMILLTQDLGGEMLQRTRAGGDRATKLAIETARVKLQVDSEVRSRLPGKEKALARGDELLKNAQKELQAAEAELTAGNVGEGFRRAQFALRNLPRDGAQLLASGGRQALGACKRSLCGHIQHVAATFRAGRQHGLVAPHGQSATHGKLRG